MVDFDFDPEEIVRYGTKPISLGGGIFLIKAIVLGLGRSGHYGPLRAPRSPR